MTAGGPDVLALQRRVAELEDELLEQAARAEEAVATAQERSYWPDRLEIDFDAVMAHPAGRGAVWAILKGRGLVRRLRWYAERARQRAG